ncbi:MAG: ribosomal protein [Acidobacteria bacterium]|nr:ribosomal protein [Acidobacteriota bacterium]
MRHHSHARHILTKKPRKRVRKLADAALVSKADSKRVKKMLNIWRKKILGLAKGYRLTKSKLHRSAKESVDRALQFSYRDRRTKKREFRSLFIVRLGAAARRNNISYSKFISGLKKAGITLDRRILAEIAIKDPEAFTQIAESAKAAIAAA